MRIHADSCGFMWIHVDFKDSHNDGAGIRGGSIVESVCCPRGDGWTVGDVPPVFEMVTSGDGVFLKVVIRINQINTLLVETVFCCTCQSAARGFVWPHTMMMVMVVPASEVEASSSRCADHMVMVSS